MKKYFLLFIVCPTLIYQDRLFNKYENNDIMKYDNNETIKKSL